MAGGTPRLWPYYASRCGEGLTGCWVAMAAACPHELVRVRGVERDMHALRLRPFRASRGGGRSGGKRHAPAVADLRWPGRAQMPGTWAARQWPIRSNRG